MDTLAKRKLSGEGSKEMKQPEGNRKSLRGPY